MPQPMSVKVEHSPSTLQTRFITNVDDMILLERTRMCILNQVIERTAEKIAEEYIKTHSQNFLETIDPAVVSAKIVELVVQKMLAQVAKP